MAIVQPRRGTHEVLNQVPPLQDYNLFEQDRVLSEAVEREAGGWGLEQLTEFGRVTGERPLQLGALVDRNPPLLRTHDRNGRRIDQVEFHPAWTELLHLGIRAGIPSLPWRDPRRGSHVVRGALLMLLSQAEAGVGCPLSMTYASIPSLRHSPGLAGEWEPRILDSNPETSALIGMAMTEKQGGSDVRANTTRAEPLGRGTYEITGHKWFCSHPVSDAFLVLAQAPGGLSCFLLPRALPDGSRNGFHIQRLKDKLGTRALASAEVEFDAATAWLVGEEGRGVPTIIDMVNHTRLDCVLGSAAGMRKGVAEATHHAAHRATFGNLLIEQPLMQNVLADLCIESEAATQLAIRLARAYDPGEDVAFRRLATAVAKYWICKRATPHAVEALECLGGNGYVEEYPLARLLRDSPLNSIWEGSGNVIALDVLRGLARNPGAFDAVMAEVNLARGSDQRLDAASDEVRQQIFELATNPDTAQYEARRVVERLAIVLQGSLVVRYSPPPAAEAFLATRVAGDAGRAFGTLPTGIDCQAIIDRHRPKVSASS
ncbi:MAG TPA: acyl-CoA dehydrogenase family protein [Actinomycetota bacterium]|nr:acyl-CoA dehydrogenase family protein [Actinomycetota bacterium]